MGAGFVFLSYARADSAAAAWLCDFLEQQGVAIWRDTAEIAVGSWRAEIDRGVSGSAVIFLIVTPTSMASVEVVREITSAADQRKTIIPLIFEPSAYPDGLRNALAGLQVILVHGEHRRDAHGKISRALTQLGFVLKDVGDAGPISSAIHQSTVRPEFNAKFATTDISSMLREAEVVRSLAPTNLYAQLSVAALLMHSGADEAAHQLCKTAIAQFPTNADALHYLSISELRNCPARRMTLGQLEAVEKRASMAYTFGGSRGHYLLPLGVAASDYRVRFGGMLPHGGPSQIASRIRASEQNAFELARFFSLVRTDFMI